MNLINLILSLSILDSIFNTDVYGFKNFMGNLLDLILNFSVIFFGLWCLINYKTPNYIKKNFLFFVGISFLSMIINQSGLINMVEFILRYGKIYFLIFISFHFGKNISLNSLFKTFTIINSFNFILNLLWYFNLSFITNKYIGTLDFATGVMGDALYQCLFSFTTLVLSFFILLNERKFNHSILLFNIITAIIQLYWSYAYHFYIVLLLSIITILFLVVRMRNHNKIIISFLICLFTVNQISKSEFFTNSFITLANTSPKIASYRDSFNGEYQKFYQEFIGVGPGSGGSYIGIENKSFISENYFSIYNYFTEKLRHGSITTLPNTGITTLKSELGYFGLINFLILLGLIFRKLNKTSKNKIGTMETLSMLLILIFLLENLFADYLQHSLFPLLIFTIVGITLGKK